MMSDLPDGFPRLRDTTQPCIDGRPCRTWTGTGSIQHCKLCRQERPNYFIEPNSLLRTFLCRWGLSGRRLSIIEAAMRAETSVWVA